MWRNPWERNKLIRELGYRWEWTNERPATGIRFGIECTDGTKDEACSIIVSSTNDKPEDRILGAEKDYTHTACMTSHTNPIQKPSTKSKAWRVKELSYLDSCYFLTSLFFYILTHLMDVIIFLSEYHLGDHTFGLAECMWSILDHCVTSGLRQGWSTKEISSVCKRDYFKRCIKVFILSSLFVYVLLFSSHPPSLRSWNSPDKVSVALQLAFCGLLK